MSDFSVTTDSASAPVDSVTFVVTNNGPSSHEFVVVALNAGETSDPAAGNLPIAASGDFEGRVDEDALEGTGQLLGAIEEEDLPDGATASVTFTLPAGKYALICNIPAHCGSGMWNDFTVTSADAPAQPQAPPTGNGGLRAASDSSGGFPSTLLVTLGLAAIVVVVGSGTVVAARKRS